MGKDLISKQEETLRKAFVCALIRLPEFTRMKPQDILPLVRLETIPRLPHDIRQIFADTEKYGKGILTDQQREEVLRNPDEPLPFRMKGIYGDLKIHKLEVNGHIDFNQNLDCIWTTIVSVDTPISGRIHNHTIMLDNLKERFAKIFPN